MAKSIGIDVGGTNFRVGIFEGLKLLNEHRIEANFSQICQQNTANTAWSIILTMLCEAISMRLTAHADIHAIGIGFPGFIHPVSGVLAQSPNFKGLLDVNLAADLTAKIGKKVHVTNDANAAAYGEFCLLNKPEAGLIYLGLGTGVGGGLIVNNKPFVGANGCAMEIGHIQTTIAGRQCGCGLQGCLEQYASATGVAKSYFEATNKLHTAHEIATLARTGDTNAQNAYLIAAEALATALAHILKVVDVPNVVIGGGMSGAWDLMQNAFDARLEADLIPVLRGKIKVTISTANDSAGMLGAAMLACS